MRLSKGEAALPRFALPIPKGGDPIAPPQAETQKALPALGEGFLDGVASKRDLEPDVQSHIEPPRQAKEYSLTICPTQNE